MSHELRTPLNVIIGFGELLSQEELSEQQHANLAHIVDAGKEMLELTEQALEISRAELGNLALRLESVDLCEVARTQVASAEWEAARREVVLSRTIPVVPRTVRADSGRLEQALRNLLRHALKQTSAGGELELVVSSDADGNAVLELCRIDDRASVQELTGRLRSGEGEAELSDDGSLDLGLAVAAALVEAMGGQLSVETLSGLGARYTVNLKAPVGGQRLAAA